MVEVISAKPDKDFRVRVVLSDGRTGTFDTSPYLEKGIFVELKDPKYFRKVRVEYGAIAWPHGQDFAPETVEYELREDALSDSRNPDYTPTPERIADQVADKQSTRGSRTTGGKARKSRNQQTEETFE